MQDFQEKSKQPQGENDKFKKFSKFIESLKLEQKADHFKQATKSAINSCKSIFKEMKGEKTSDYLKDYLKKKANPINTTIITCVCGAFLLGIFSVDMTQLQKRDEQLLKRAQHEGYLYETAFEKRPPIYPMETLAKLEQQISIVPLLTTYDLTVNGEIVGRFQDAKTPKSILAELLSLSEEGDYQDVKYSYKEDVHIVRNIVPAYRLGKYDEFEPALNYIKSGQKESTKYTVVKGDYIEKIAAKFGVTPKDLMEINPTVLSKKYLQIGDELVIMHSKPLINAKLSYVAEYTEAIEAEVEIQKNAKMYEGEEKTIKEGEDGEQKVVARIIKNNGLILEKQVLENQILKQPTKKVKMVGTKPLPIKLASSSIQSRSKSYGVEKKELRGGLKLQSPLASYIISSRYGGRWGRFHHGIDLATPRGTPVYAAEAGTVTVSTTNGRGYGHYIKINHGSGVSTVYAHCSTLLVEVGQKVEKGQLIAKSGNTGISTGPHVHFEVLIDGNSQNPERFYNF